MSRLDSIRQRLQATTPGPWKKCGASDGLCSCGFIHNKRYEVCYVTRCDEIGGRTCPEEEFQANKEFIANSKQDVEYLLGEVDRLKTEIRRVSKVWRAAMDTFDRFKKTFDELAGR